MIQFQNISYVYFEIGNHLVTAASNEDENEELSPRLYLKDIDEYNRRSKTYAL
jgi:hypothetical protein